jgi:RNA polymerase sigma factor (TIGR02999 family)
VSDAASISDLLHAHGSGDASAFERVVPLVYDELRRIARHHLRRTSRGVSLDTTGLVHEAYLKLAGAGLRVEDRRHLLAVAARAMRQVIVSRARARAAQKRGGGAVAVPIEEEAIAAAGPSAEWLLALDDALLRLREHDERLVRIVECRFFAGFSEEETAQALDLSLRSVQRGWMKARAWLALELGKPA